MTVHQAGRGRACLEHLAAVSHRSLLAFGQGCSRCIWRMRRMSPLRHTASEGSLVSDPNFNLHLFPEFQTLTYKPV
jgi:hypothetical protein